MPNPIFLLSLDVDETLINGQSETPQKTDCDFNGSDEFNDPCAWIELIHYIDKQCSDKGYELIVNLIAAKASGTVDDSIDACHRSDLTNYLQARDSKGSVIAISSADRYLVRRHLFQNVSSELFYNKLLECNQSKSDEGERIEEEQIMPAVHICCENKADKSTSKALVLEEVRSFYDITPSQMLHIDNSNAVEADLRSGSNGETPSFKSLNCHPLKALEFEDKSERTGVTRMLIKTFKAQILQQVSLLPVISNLGAASSASPFLISEPKAAASEGLSASQEGPAVKQYGFFEPEEVRHEALDTSTHFSIHTKLP